MVNFTLSFYILRGQFYVIITIRPREYISLSQNMASEIVGNTNLGKIDTLLSQGHDMEYIARHSHMDIALAWALRLELKKGSGKIQMKKPFNFILFSA